MCSEYMLPCVLSEIQSPSLLLVSAHPSSYYLMAQIQHLCNCANVFEWQVRVPNLCLFGWVYGIPGGNTLQTLNCNRVQRNVQAHLSIYA